MASQASSSGGFIGNMMDNPKNEICKAIKLKNKLVPSEPRWVKKIKNHVRLKKGVEKSGSWKRGWEKFRGRKKCE